MTPTRILIGQIAIVLAIVIAGSWISTEWAASHLGFQWRLGPAWFRFLRFPVYYPWRVFEWWYAYEAYAPNVFNTAGMIAASGGLAGAASAVIGSVWRARQSRVVTTYGSARWASLREVVGAGLTRSAGIVLGQMGAQYLRHDGPEHVMAFAPTRSGKGVGLVVPTLLTWPGSAVIHDIKGENWQLTAGWRSRFSHCLLCVPCRRCTSSVGVIPTRPLSLRPEALGAGQEATNGLKHFKKTPLLGGKRSVQASKM
jgi:type IV secretion system protein VirD4